MVKIIQRTLLLFFITSFLFFFSPIHAMDKIETVGGVLQVKEKELEGRTLYLRGKKIPKIENELIDILEKYRIGQNDIVLIRDNCLGNVCVFGNGQFLTIKPDGRYNISKKFALPDEGYLTRQVGNMILVKYQDHLKYITITYDAGEIKVKESKSPEAYGKVKEKDCREVFNLYVSHCDKACTSADFSRAGMGTYNYYMEDERFKMDVFDDLCKKACTGVKPIDYSQFSKKVCGR